jgi:hypothetical protein
LFSSTTPFPSTNRRSAEKSTLFYTGDVWKAVLYLTHYRPDLKCDTAHRPDGHHRSPSSRVLAECRDEVVKRFMDLSYTDVENRLRDQLNIVPNEWDAVLARLNARWI